MIGQTNNRPLGTWDRPADYFGTIPAPYIELAFKQVAEETGLAGTWTNLRYSAGSKTSGFSDSDRKMMNSAIRDRAIRLMVDDYLVVRGEIVVGGDMDYRRALNQAIEHEIRVHDHFKEEQEWFNRLEAKEKEEAYSDDGC